MFLFWKMNDQLCLENRFRIEKLQRHWNDVEVNIIIICEK